MDSDEYSDKSRATTLALVIPLGMFGGHRFYVGKFGTGFLQLLTVGGLGLWWLYDLILISFGEFEDGQGRKVVTWQEGARGMKRLPESTAQEILDELYAMREEMAELGERVDFTERLLTEQRDKLRLSE